MNSYDISVTSRPIDRNYIMMNRAIKFLLFFVITYWIVNGEAETFYKVVLLMVLFYLLDYLMPSCEINIIEQKVGTRSGGLPLAQ